MNLIHASTLRIGLAATVLCLILCGILYNENRLAREGIPATLSVEGFDPRDILSGNYVELSFFSEQNIAPKCYGETYLGLKRERGKALVIGDFPSPEAVRKAGLIGTIGSCQFDKQDEKANPPYKVRVMLPISRFYANAETALALEKALQDPQTQAIAEISLGSDGKARLRALIVNGKRYPA